MAHKLTGLLYRNVITLDTTVPLSDKEASQRVQVVLEPLDAGRHGPPARMDDRGAVPPGLRELIRSGKARGGGRNSPDLYPRLAASLKHGTAQELLDEERGDR